MGVEEKDPSKSMEWKGFEESVNGDPGDGVVVKKRVRRRMRQIPDCYFLPRRPLSNKLLVYGASIAGGIGAAMLTEIWISKEVKEDGGITWQFDK